MPEPVRKPQDYGKVETFAWYIVLGETIAEASKFAGIADNTARNWMASDWWPEELVMARERIPPHMISRALSGIIHSMNERNVATCKWVAERMIDALASPAKREPQEVSEKRTVPGFSIGTEGDINRFLGVGEVIEVEEDE